MKQPIAIVTIFFVSIFFAFGQDIRGGEIVYSSVSNYTYTCNAYLYTQTSIGINHSTILAIIGDGSTSTLTGTSIDFSNDITEWHYSFTHTYPANGIYNISIQDSFRIADIQNIINSSSERILLQTNLNINPNLGVNSSPVLLNRQTDVSISGSDFVHNPNAYDPDGDSLVYSLVPTTSTTYSLPSGAIINSLTGDFQMPISSGINAINIQIDEWRLGINIASTFREMLIDSSSIAEVNELKAEKDLLKIFPNPVKDILTLELLGNISEAQVRVSNLLEQELFHLKMQSKEKYIDVSNLADGLYLIESTAGNKISRQKFIKQ